MVQTFDYAGHTLTWEEHSPGEHTLLFLHGWSVGRATWKPLIHPFFPLGRCVTLDLPGHYPAQSPPNYQRITQEELIDLETHAVKHICGDEPVTLIGHSAGGLAALGIAARLPQNVKRVICINSVVWSQFTGIVNSAQWLLRNGLYPYFESIWNFALQDTWTLMLGLSFFVHQQQAFWKSDLAWTICEETHSWYHLHSLSELVVFLNLLDNCDIRPIIANLDVPVLVVVGVEDPVLPAEQSFWLADNLPNVELRAFENTGHIPQVEAPVAFTQVLSDWLIHTQSP